ncbi:MAG: phytoene/squalene synthase family protein [Verrucomicrobia bacterium]|nr:phytoene/squalene synthase family protein [Verrucomicrobiota bacterium]
MTAQIVSPIQAPEHLLSGLLRDVSRSFYLTLRILPGKVRTPIGLAYLLARTTDTIADTELVNAEQRLKALQALRDRIQGRGELPLDFGALARHQGSRAEGVLLEKCEASLALLRGLPSADERFVREVLEIIISGQELDLRRFAGASAQSLVALRTDEELDDYTYRVAGCVGEFWTKVCRAHLFPQAPLDDAFLLVNGVRFGKGLQLVNILRDLATDLRNGRCYLPLERLVDSDLKPDDLLQSANEPRLRSLYHAYLDRAEAHLRAGWA